MSDLVDRLSDGAHPVDVCLRPERTVEAFKACLDHGYVHLRFIGTQGGTEIGVSLDPAQTDLAAADFEHKAGRVTLSGVLTVDFTRVRCTAEIDVGSLSGSGGLTRVQG